MQIVDQTPYRTETGEIDLMGRVQGTLKFGLSWFDRLKAQDTVIALLDKQLNNAYVLLRNITLPETEITLPLILLGPAGIFLIYVAHEKGVYRAKGDEWGTIADERFAPARINHISRTKQMARVLQVYLDRQGYKSMLNVEPILMAADPGTHIDSVRPSVRIVMSDALERFAISLAQTRGTIAPEAVATIARVIVKGRPKEAPVTALPQPEPPAFQPSYGGSMFGDESAQTDDSGTSSSDLGFSFQDEEATAQEEPAAPVARPSAAARPAANAKPKKFLGFTQRQLIVLGGILLVWLCLMIVFAIYIAYNLNA